MEDGAFRLVEADLAHREVSQLGGDGFGAGDEAALEEVGDFAEAEVKAGGLDIFGRDGREGAVGSDVAVGDGVVDEMGGPDACGLGGWSGHLGERIAGEQADVYDNGEEVFLSVYGQ